MNEFHEQLIARAATIDELLSDDFEALPGQKGDAEMAARRLAAWCHSSASGDWMLFSRRLARDGLSIDEVLARFATVRRRASAPRPRWIEDAVWIEAALQSPAARSSHAMARGEREPCAFEGLLMPAVERAAALLTSSIDDQAFNNLTESAHADLRQCLLEELSSLFAPALYELFAQSRKAAGAASNAASGQCAGARYDEFVSDMKAGGFRRLFTDKPVLLRLAATLTRQWIDVAGELVIRLNADLAAIRRDIVFSSAGGRVAAIDSNLSDPHNHGRSVRILTFEDGARVVYKPKDLRLDVASHALMARLYRSGAPFELQVARAIAREGYGWTQFIAHAGTDAEGCRRFFRRAGAWLALFHCFCATDMHQENLIAAGEHPIPIDLETVLQAVAEERKSVETEAQAYETTMQLIADSVTMVGLLPAYTESPDNEVFAFGGMVSGRSSGGKLRWSNINSDTMRPIKSEGAKDTPSNLPHMEGGHAKLADHLDDFIDGFETYAKFLMHLTQDERQGGLFEGFSGATVRKVVRPTRFYSLLLRRLKNHRSMGDGVTWSAQADFLARLVDWDDDSDPFWPLHRAERASLVGLNVPYFTAPCEGQDVQDASGLSARTHALPGLARARDRVVNLDAQEIAWQVDVIRHSTLTVLLSAGLNLETRPLLRTEGALAPSRETLLSQADKIAEDVANFAIRRGSSAAWVGLDTLGDSKVMQLVPLGPAVYNGLCGIGVFLAAHAAVRRSQSSAELALAAVAYLRKGLKGRNSARLARSIGLGGGRGLGSVVYALSVIAKLLDDDAVLADARLAAGLFTDDLIAADKHLDVLDGSAGGILGLLRHHRDSPSDHVLGRAIKCGEHLLAQPRGGPPGRRSWIGQGLGPQPLNGMSHGASGFALALASLAAASGRDEFADAAEECIAFENESFDVEHSNWPDFRIGGRVLPCQWCHGAPGIGLARIGARRQRMLDDGLLKRDIEKALGGVERASPRLLDTLCCGTLGSIEFLCEAGDETGCSDLRERASRRLGSVLETALVADDYRWSGGTRRFNLGLFRGLSGVGYTMLRRVEQSLPNVLIWE